ncbi:hypothetical protein ALC53_02273 [Atta colombica]|uniref:Uncharacterized protein n=1 Tax=Atta colombica TaxID=520822 RepID=A0A195BU57_9HYME|nr:hypothetical protein ALC53_02273 [Atta colombica]
MTQVSSCGAAQCAIIKGVLFCLMDLSKFQYLENEYLEGSCALVEPQSAATSRVDDPGGESGKGHTVKRKTLAGASPDPVKWK